MIDDRRYTDVRRYLQNFGNVNLSVASLIPVPVFHGTTVHVHDTVPGVYYIVGGDILILHGYHDRCCLEGRARFHQVAYRQVSHFVVIAVVASGHVHVGFHVARGYLHHYRRT